MINFLINSDKSALPKTLSFWSNIKCYENNISVTIMRSLIRLTGYDILYLCNQFAINDALPPKTARRNDVANLKVKIFVGLRTPRTVLARSCYYHQTEPSFQNIMMLSAPIFRLQIFTASSNPD